MLRARREAEAVRDRLDVADQQRREGALLTSDTAPVEPPRCPPPAALMRTAERPGLVFCCPSLHIAAESCRSGSHGGRVYRDGETPPPNPDA